MPLGATAGTTHSYIVWTILLKDHVRLSVHLSVTRQYSVKAAKHIIKLLSPSTSHTILVFPHQTLWHRMQGYEETAIFNLYLDLSQKE